MALARTQRHRHGDERHVYLGGDGAGAFQNVILGPNLNYTTGTLTLTGFGALAFITPGSNVANALANPLNGNSGVIGADSSGNVQINMPAITTAIDGLAAVRSSDKTLGTIQLGAGLSYLTAPSRCREVAQAQPRSSRRAR